MGRMFQDAKSFKQDLFDRGLSRGISKWTVSSVTSMSGMFSGALLFNDDISKWDVSSVTPISLRPYPFLPIPSRIYLHPYPLVSIHSPHPHLSSISPLTYPLAIIPLPTSSLLYLLDPIPSSLSLRPNPLSYILSPISPRNYPLAPIPLPFGPIPSSR